MSKDYSAAIAQVQQEYERSIPEKLLVIQSLIESVQKKEDEKNYEMLIFQLHKMGGSAGCYGFKRASELCKKMRDDLQEKHNSETIRALTSFFVKLKESFR